MPRRQVFKARKKPVEIQAVLWDGINLEIIREFVGESLSYVIDDAAWQVGKGRPHVIMHIITLEGRMQVSVGDYIIKGVKGEFYPCKPEIFDETYEITEVMGEVVGA